MMKGNWLLLGLLVAGGVELLGNRASAQSVIVPDGTLGVERSRLGTVTVNGQTSLIVDSIVGGVQRGQNLFHSFQEFNVAAGRGVYFRSSDAAIQNILARVTGNKNSNIEGTLGTVGLGSPNLFLINPNGILFGKNSSLDVQGSFAATTASAIGFGTTGEFSATNPQQPGALLTVDPSAFIFASLQKPGAIVVQSQARQSVIGNNTFGLRVRNGQTLLLLGGDVLIDNGQLNAWGGRMEIGAAGAIGTVMLNQNKSLMFSAEQSRGTVTFEGGNVDVSLDNGGDLVVTAGDISVRGGSRLIAGISDGLGQVGNQAGNVVLDAADKVQVEQGSRISNDLQPESIGKGGNLVILAESVQVTDGSKLTAITFGEGDAGNVLIQARDRIVFDNGDAFSNVEIGAIGKGGNIEISTGDLEVLNGAQLNATIRGRGDAGNVIIKARNRTSFVGRSSDGKFSSVAFSNVEIGAIGKGGNIEIFTGSLDLLSGAQLSTQTKGKGDAGNVIIQARGRTVFNAGDAFSNVGRDAIGKGGNIDISTEVLEVSNGAQMVANTRGAGDAGSIVIQTRDRTVFNTGYAFSSVETGAIGKGGNVEISTKALEVLNGAQLIADTKGTGDAGNIVIQARDSVSFRGRSLDEKLVSVALSRVSTGAIGQGGNIEISTGGLELLNGAQLISNTNGKGDAGNIIIQARNRTVFNAGFTFSGVETGAIGKGGNIKISTVSLELLNGSQLIAQTTGEGDAGSLLISATNSITLSGTNPTNGKSSATFTSTASPDRNGGNITLNTRAFRLTDGAVVDARTSSSGTSGDITINANTIDVLNGGQVLAITEGRGRAGTIALNANDRITIQGSDATYDQRFAQFGRAVAPISPNSGIFVQSQASGGAGNIIVNSPNLGLDRSGTISAISSTVDGGNITLNIGKLMTLRNGSQISATAGTANAGGNGGNITLNSPNGFLIAIPNENSDITANAFNGSGGKVSITNQGIFGLQFRPKLTELSDITASSQFGFSGTVIINSPDNSAIQNSLNQLPTGAIDTTKLLANTCIVRKDKPEGTFYITGTGGLPNRPGDLSPSQYPTSTIQSTQTATRPWQKGDPIEEPQGFYQLSNGRLVMSRECSSTSTIAQP
jgi:filamentous hemagglutinin family protein